MNAKEYLQQGYKLNELIKNNKEHLKELELLSTSIPAVNVSNERVQSSPVSFDKIGNVVAKIIDFQAELNDEISEYIDFQKDVHTKILQIPNKNESLVLFYRYIHFYTWEKIAVELDYTFQWVHVLHKKALISFEKILNS